MEIQKNCVVGLTWVMRDTLNEELDVLDESVDFLIGGHDLFTVIEEALIGKTVGYSVEIQVEPEQGFGEFNDQLIFLEKRNLFPIVLEEGMTFDGSALPIGCNSQAPKDTLYTVTDIYPDHVVIDGNHPLAGIALRLKITVNAIRLATKEEITNGSAGTGFFKVKPLDPILTGPITLH